MTDIIKNLVVEGYPVTQKHFEDLVSMFSKNGKGTRTPEITYIETDAMIVGRYDNFFVQRHR